MGSLPSLTTSSLSIYIFHNNKNIFIWQISSLIDPQSITLLHLCSLHFLLTPDRCWESPHACSCSGTSGMASATHQHPCNIASVISLEAGQGRDGSMGGKRTGGNRHARASSIHHLPPSLGGLWVEELEPHLFHTL